MYVSKRKTETKGESFERIATARVNKISIMIRRLSNCSTASNYAFTEKQVEKIFDYTPKVLCQQNCVDEKYICHHMEYNENYIFCTFNPPKEVKK